MHKLDYFTFFWVLKMTSINWWNYPELPWGMLKPIFWNFPSLGALGAQGRRIYASSRQWCRTYVEASDMRCRPYPKFCPSEKFERLSAPKRSHFLQFRGKKHFKIVFFREMLVSTVIKLGGGVKWPRNDPDTAVTQPHVSLIFEPMAEYFWIP